MNAEYDIIPIIGSTTLGDLFLDILEKNANDNTRHFIQETRILMTNFDYAELFTVILINALGYYAQISESKVDNAITFMVKKNELSIDAIPDITTEEKYARKQIMNTFFCICKQQLKEYLRFYNVLI